MIEAEGEQAPLEALANELAQDFLLSTYLLESRIVPAAERLGSNKPLKETDAQLPFCQHCQPQFGDNQHANFAQLVLPCSHCHGERVIEDNADLAALQVADLVNLATQLLSGETITLTDVIGSIQLGRQPFNDGDSAVLVCNPNTLSEHFVLENRQVLSLSSIEKPLLLLKPQPTSGISQSLIPVGFAASRLQQVLCELLRVKGVDWLYIKGAKRSVFANVLGVDLPVQSQACQLTQAGTGFTLAEPLHESVRFGNYVAVASGNRKQPQIISSLSTEQNVWDSTDTRKAAECAALALGAEFGQSSHYALIYFSEQYDSQILVRDDKGSLTSFLTLPKLPANGSAIHAAMQISEHAGVWQKFVGQQPAILERLLALDLNDYSAATLNSLWAVAAVLIGLNGESAKSLATSFVSSAMANCSANSPRIDFPLVKREDGSSTIDWTKAIGTLVSFRLAGDNDEAKLAFAMHDSLADFIANWIERLDLNSGIERVYLAGSDIANPVIVKRLGLRLGKNFPMASSQQQDLDGALLATGALYLRQRRG
ncbi:hypothetical protein [Shewanella mangrovi]|nr:hypothetical protein [Shewanella mangrovi]